MLTYLPWSYWLGALLLIWLIYDLVRGVAYIWQPYSRQQQPTMYWFTMFVWALVAVSCFIFPNWSIS
jgi:hypothetical protein